MNIKSVNINDKKTLSCNLRYIVSVDVKGYIQPAIRP